MSDSSAIEWTDATWNPTTGCHKISPGCKNCYAKREWTRLSANPKSVYFKRAFEDVAYHTERLDQPIRWKNPRRIFVNSMSDLFDDDVPDQFIADVFAHMAYARQHTFQLLTKRSARMRTLLTSEAFAEQYEDAIALASDVAEGILGRRRDFDQNARLTTDIRAFDPVLPLANVWLGVSVENDEYAGERIPPLLQTPAAVRWISAEPLLGQVNCGMYLSRTNMPGLRLMPGFRDPLPGIDWVVAGGESGPKARPSHPGWFRSLRDQCLAAGVPFFFKQWGEWVSVSEVEGKGDHHHFDDGATVRRVGKQIAGRQLDGREWNEYPQ